jgi:uncharacterized lipoprotein NlpE involved in copper resistance
MRRVVLAACLLALSVAGCRRSPSPSSDALAPTPGDAIEWQGMRPCADCAAIHTSLVLRNDHGQRRYQLTETYLAERGGTRFIEPGSWQRTHALLRLQGAGGSLRVFAMLPDGRLQARDRHGRRPRTVPTQELLPVAISRGESAPADAPAR